MVPPILWQTAQAAPAAVTRHVRVGATEGNDCWSWDTACPLQKAVNASLPGDQVWVAAGVYTPTNVVGRDASFYLRSGVAVYGGFPATGKPGSC